jgi:hypothetical protein
VSGGPPWALPGEVRGIRVNAEAYEAAVRAADAWPDGWPHVWHETGRVWRADVFGIVDAWRGGIVPTRHLLTAVCAWGHGANGYGPWRTAKTLNATELDERLAPLDVLRAEHVSTDNLIATYQAFGDFRQSRLPWFRAPFFTKLLYFAAYRRGSATVQPLILDSVVARRLPDEAGVRRPVGRRVPAWTSMEWLRYLTWAGAQAPGGESDLVEMRLFNGM